MALVQTNVIKLLNLIDPLLKTTQVEVTSTNIATWSSDGTDRFTAQRIVDIYNFARFAYFNALKTKLGESDALSKEIGEQIVSKTDLAFTLASTISTAPKPSGYAKFIALSNASDVKIIMLPIKLADEVRIGNNLDYKQSATNMFVFDIGTNFVSFGTQGVNSGNSFLTTLSTYKLLYYGITTYTIADVTGGSTVESFNDKDIPNILELAQAIASEQGNEKVNALALKLVGV